MDDFSLPGGFNQQRGGNEDYMYSILSPPFSSHISPTLKPGPAVPAANCSSAAVTSASSLQSPLGSSGQLPLEVNTIKARIIAHPHYPNLIGAYLNCHKVGAPPEFAGQLSTIVGELELPQPMVDGGSDPELDQFMEAYYHMLVKYREELARPLNEAADFLQRVESQFNSVTGSCSRLHRFADDLGKTRVCLSVDDQLDCSSGEAVVEVEAEPRAGDRKLKLHLLKKYSGHLSSLQQELSKKKKKGKLPKEARQMLLGWWELHQKWPYPSESEKVALADSTSLDQKQINNWFINQRKRHWKPPEDMQFMVLDGYHHQQNVASFYMDGGFMDDGSMYLLGP